MTTEFPKILRQKIREEEINAFALAEDLGVESSVVYQWLKGVCLPSGFTICSVADYFGCTVDEMLGEIR